MEKQLSNEQSAKKILSNIKNKHKITYENGKIVFYNSNFTYSYFLLFLGFIFFIIFAFSRSNILLVICIITFISYFLLKRFFSTYYYYYIIDYNCGLIYFEKRNEKNSTLSKKTILRIKDIVSVGVDNLVRKATEHEIPDLVVTNQIFYSFLVFLSSDGKVYNILKFLNFTYEDNCILAESLAVLFGVPLFRCPRKFKLKAVKTPMGYRFDKEELKIDSIMTNFVKRFFIFVGICVVGAIFCIVYEMLKK